MSASTVSPMRAVSAICRGYRPRLFQGLGWVVAGLPMAPVALFLLIQTLARLQGHQLPPGGDSIVFHTGLVAFMVPLMALIASYGGIREDLERRTLPLLLTRPVPAWCLPLAKGTLWSAWGGLWLVIAALALALGGAGFPDAFFQILALLGIFWGELALFTLLGLLLKRGNLWGALALFIWERLVWVFPPSLQRLTFVHYAQSIAGSRAAEVGVNQLLAQTQVDTPWPLALAVLLTFSALCWALAGWKLEGMPVGLAGADAEG